MNIGVINVPYSEGMAGTKRVRNIIEPFKDENNVSIFNIYFGSKEDPLRNEAKSICITGLFSMTHLSAFKLIEQNFDSKSQNVLYHYGYPSVKTIGMVLRAKLLGYFVIFDIVEDNRAFNREHFYSTKSRLNNYVSTILIKYISLLGDACIVISGFLNSYVTDLSKRKIPVIQIPISVDTTQIGQSTYDIKNHLTIFYGGSFAPKDGIELLIDSFEKVSVMHPGVILKLTGKGNEGDLARLKNRIEVSPVKEKVKFLGFLSTEQYVTELTKADIVCMTRVNSDFANAGFPFKLGEYLASGKAVVATRVGEIEEYLINEENAILIDPGSVTDFVSALDKLIKLPSLRKYIGLNARVTAIEHFDSSLHSYKFYSLLTNIKSDA